MRKSDVYTIEQSVEVLLHECITAIESAAAFDWDDYLQETCSAPLPAENLLYFQAAYFDTSAILPDSWIEAETGPNTFWPAKILDVYDCGLFRIQWYGSTAEPVWWDIDFGKICSLWFAKENGFAYKPPENQCDLASKQIDEIIASFDAELSSESSIATATDLCLKKKPAFEEILANCSGVEILDSADPRIVHVASIISRKTAHIRVSYCDTFEWISIHSWRLRPLQWAAIDGSKFGCFYDENSLRVQMENSAIAETFRQWKSVKNTDFTAHNLQPNMSVEAIEPRFRSCICVGVIPRVINEFFFIVCPESGATGAASGTTAATGASSTGATGAVSSAFGAAAADRFVCIANQPGIFYPHWARQHSIKVRSVVKGEEFQWTSYLKAKNLKSAPSGNFAELSDDHEFPNFFVGAKLEFLYPWSSEPLIVGGTVIKFVAPLASIRVDSPAMVGHTILVDIREPVLFPCGFAQANDYFFIPPAAIPRNEPCVTADFNSENTSTAIFCDAAEKNFMPAKYSPANVDWCTIFINPRCYFGPYLNHFRILELPKQIGPGPVELVLRRLFSWIFSAAFKPRECLQSNLQSNFQSDGIRPRFALPLKIRKGTRMFEQSIETCIEAKSLPETLKIFCAQLNGCPNFLTCGAPANFLTCGAPAPIPEENFCHLQCKTEIKPIYDWIHDLFTWKKRQQQKHSAVSITDRSRRPSILTPLTVQTRNKIAKLSTAAEAKIKEEKENEFVAEVFDAKIFHSDVFDKAKPPPWKIPKVEEGGAMAAKQQQQQLAWDVKVPEINTDPLYWTCAEVVEYLKKTDASFLAAVMEHEQMDGQALMLLNLETAKERLNLSLGSALKLCSIALKLKHHALSVNAA